MNWRCMVCYQSSLATKRPVSVPRLATTVESASDRVVLRLRIAARPVSMGNHHRVRDPIMVICRARPLLGVYYLRAAWLRSAITHHHTALRASSDQRGEDAVCTQLVPCGYCFLECGYFSLRSTVHPLPLLAVKCD